MPCIELKPFDGIPEVRGGSVIEMDHFIERVDVTIDVDALRSFGNGERNHSSVHLEIVAARNGKAEVRQCVGRRFVDMENEIVHITVTVQRGYPESS